MHFHMFLYLVSCILCHMFMATNLDSYVNSRHPLNNIIIQTPMITLYPQWTFPPVKVHVFLEFHITCVIENVYDIQRFSDENDFTPSFVAHLG